MNLLFCRLELWCVGVGWGGGGKVARCLKKFIGCMPAPLPPPERGRQTRLGSGEKKKKFLFPKCPVYNSNVILWTNIIQIYSEAGVCPTPATS